MTYDHANAHRATQIKDEFGNIFTVTYVFATKIGTITDTAGRQVIKEYDLNYNIKNSKDPGLKNTIVEYELNIYSEEKKITDRNGFITQYERDANGNITRQINPDSTDIHYSYDTKNNLINKIDESEKRTIYVYDNETNLTKKVKPLNGTDNYTEGTSNPANYSITSYTYFTEAERITNGYLVKGLVKTSTDPEGNVTTYTYDTFGNINSIKDAENKITTFTYNTQGWKTSETTPGNVKTTFEYDKNGNLARTKVFVGTVEKEVSRTLYDSNGRKIQEISANLYDSTKDTLTGTTNQYSDANAGYRYSYLPNGKLAQVKDPCGKTTIYGYDDYGNMSSETKDNLSIYLYEYDVMNRVKKIQFKDADGQAAITLKDFAYDILPNKNDKITTIEYCSTTANDLATSIVEKDFADRVVNVTNADGTTNISTYNPNGTLATTVDGRGNTTYYSYDGFDRLVAKWVPNTSTQYNYSGYVYDKASKIKEERSGKNLVALNSVPLSTECVIKYYDYYLNGKVKTETDSAGRKIAYFYDDNGIVNKKEVYTSVTEKNVTEYVNNEFGKPTQIKIHVKDGDLYPNTFSSANDIVKTSTLEYDKNGNVTKAIDANNISTNYTYDNMDRQLSKSVLCQDETGTLVTVANSATYDWNGKVITSTDAKGNLTTNTYNPRGLLIKTTNPKNGVLAFYYDFAGRKIADVTPKHYDSAKTLTQMNRTEYLYDKMGRLISKIENYYDTVSLQWVSANVENMKYDANGNVIKKTDGKSYSTASGTDLAKIDNGYGTEYEYNKANQVIKVTDAASKDKGLTYTTLYSYDGIGRTVSETNAKGHVTRYFYDDAGNLTKTTIALNSGAAQDIVNQATYDLTGKILTQTDGKLNVTQFSYNGFGEVRTVISPGDSTMPANTVSYQYNSVGNLVWEKNTVGTVELYSYDNLGRELSHTQQNAAGGQGITNSVKYDKNGNIRYEVDGKGTVKENTFDELNRLLCAKVTVTGGTSVEHKTLYSYECAKRSLAISVGESPTWEKASHRPITVGLRA